MMKYWLGGVAAAALGMTSFAVLAHEGHDDGKKVEKRITIIKRGDGGKEIDGAEAHVIHARCKAEGQAVGTDVETEKDGKKQRTHIMICGKADADAVAALEKARGEIAGEEGLSEEHRTKALAALDAEIARLKSSKKSDE